MGESTREKYIKHGSVLAITSFLVRIIGMLYRIPMTAVIGDRGNGLYAAAFEIYNIILLVSTYTLPMAISKIVSPYFARGNFKSAYKFYRLSLVFALLAGVGFFALAFFGADFLSGTMLRSPMSAYALRVLAPTILVVSLMGVIRGFFQSTGSMIQTSVSQIIEQLVNAVISVLAAAMLFTYGSKLEITTGNPDFPYAYGAAGGTLGTFSGALIGFFYLVITVLVFNGRIKSFAQTQNIRESSPSYSEMLRMLLLTIIPIIISTAIYNLNTILNQAVYYHTSVVQNISAAEYESMWGIFSGKYRLLTNVPIAVASSMVTSVIPSLSVSVNARAHNSVINKKLRNTVKIVMIFIIPCVVGFIVLGRPMIDMLFNGSEASQKMAGNMMVYGSVVVLFTALSTLSTGFLQGLGYMRVPMVNSLIALIIQIVLFRILLYATPLGIYSMLIANLVFVFLIFLLNATVLKKYVGYRQEIARTFVLPGFASLIMGGITFGIYRGLMLLTRNRNGISTILSIFVAMAVYFVLIIKFRVLAKKELAQLPKGMSLVRFGEKLNLW